MALLNGRYRLPTHGPPRSELDSLSDHLDRFPKREAMYTSTDTHNERHNAAHSFVFENPRKKVCTKSENYEEEEDGHIGR